MSRFKHIFFSPLVFYSALVVALLPSFFCLLHFFQAHGDLAQLQGRLSALKSHSAYVQRAQEQEIIRLQRLKEANPAYLEQQLESLLFLEGEIKRLQVITSDRGTERLHFLRDGRNSLRFIEQNFRKKHPFQETDVRTEHPVEMDAEDLKRFLARIEEIQAPELRFKLFELSRKTPSPQEEVYLVNFELIKRELIRE